jgi:hypothetical protein
MKWFQFFSLLVALLGINFYSVASAQTNFGPNPGLIQRQMMMPGSTWFGRAPDMFYGPVTREEAGLSSRDYENPVVVQDGIIHAQIMNPIQPPLKVVPLHPKR